MGGLGLALLSTALGPAAVFAADPPDSAAAPDPRTITWQSAFVAGTVVRATPADTKPLQVRGDMPAELHLILEGVHGGLPIYCSPAPQLRIDGRVLPERLIVDPSQAGLTEVEIHWIELRPADIFGNWHRSRLAAADGRWSYSAQRFPGDPAPGMHPEWGTGRFAAAIQALDANENKIHFGTYGWTKSPDWLNPDSPPGFRVTRTDRGVYLSDRVVGLARLPVDPRASDTHCWQRIAVRPVDLILAAYEDFAGVRLPTPRTEPIAGEAWSWLFTREHRGLLRLRSENSSAPVMAPGGRGVSWGRGLGAGPPLVQTGDVLLAGDDLALLDRDDGDGWLSEGDFVFHTLHGQVERGRLAELPGRTLDILRTRNFFELKLQLEQAGYGGADGPGLFGPRLRKACREFQRDRGLEETGVPDETMRRSLQEFLDRMRSTETTEEVGTTP